ncbi:hypothetical protein SDC9_73170 [bioreactor metagenome]|uniref:Uncharacterized protein n=1 Tax=bioreactor metagenome TaxID=1076179 RepID=A0A644YDP2_9ZZZZ
MGIQRIDRVLHHQLRHDFPGIPRGGVCVMRAVNLRHVAPGDELLALCRVHKRAQHVDVAIDHVILRILMAAVHALFRKHDGDIRPGHATDIAVVVDGSADLVLDQIKRFSLRAHLFARNRNPAAALRRAFDQPVKVALSGSADDHDVIRAVMRRHAHTANVVLKPAARNLGGDHGHGLRIHVAKIMRGGKRNAVLERLAAIMIGKRPHGKVRRGLAPGPAAAARTIVLQILQNLSYINILFRRQAIFTHLAPPNSAAARSSAAGFISASPASRTGRLFSFA